MIVYIHINRNECLSMSRLHIGKFIQANNKELGICAGGSAVTL